MQTRELEQPQGGENTRCSPGRHLRRGNGRVAYFINTYPAISQTFIRRELEALEALGWRPSRFAIRRPLELVDPCDKVEEGRTSYLLPFRPRELFLASLAVFVRPRKALAALRLALRMAIASERSFARSMFALPEAVVLFRRLKQLRIRHVHAHFGTNTTAVLVIIRAMGGPTYSFTNHGPEEYDKVFNISLHQKICAAAFVVAITNFGRAQLLRWTPYEMWNKIHIVRCGLHFSESGEKPSPVPSNMRLVAIGRLSEEKGHVVLLRAVARLIKDKLPVSLVLAGDGPLRSLLEREIESLGLSGVVRMAGWVDGNTVNELLRSSRALVLPSFAEGLPIVLMESYRAGRPAIAANVGGIAELVEPGVSGWLVPPGDEDKLVACLREALTLPTEKLNRMGQAGYQSVRRMHDVLREARKLSDLFERVLLPAAIEGEDRTGNR